MLWGISPISSKKTVPPWAVLQQAGLGFGRSCVGAFFVAEQLVFHQLLVQRRAVECHQGAFAAAALGVNGLGRQFLARAGFTREQDVAVRGGHLGDGFGNPDHLRALADDQGGIRIGLVVGAYGARHVAAAFFGQWPG